jgi:hypothetical protein
MNALTDYLEETAVPIRAPTPAPVITPPEDPADELRRLLPKAGAFGSLGAITGRTGGAAFPD